MTATAETTMLMPPASTAKPKAPRKAAASSPAPPAEFDPRPAVQLDIAIALLDDNPDNPRRDVGNVAELAASITAAGLLQPLVVVPSHLYRADGTVDDGRYTVIAGHRRKAACAAAGLTTVPCLVREDLVGPAARAAMLVENLQRVDLTALEEAQAFQALVDLKLSQRDIAERVGRSQGHVSKRLALLSLPPIVQERVVDGSLTLEEARALAPIVKDDGRLRDVLDSRPSWETVEQAVARHVSEIQRADKVAELITQLKKEGKTYVKTASWDAHLNQFDDKTRKGHSKLACHGFTIRSWGEPELIPVCTDPRKHKPGGPRADDAEARRQEQEEKAARTAAREERLVHVRNMLSGKPSKELEAFALDAALEAILEWREGDTTGGLLGLPALADDAAITVDEQLLEFARRSPAHRIRVIAAVLIDNIEHRLSWRLATPPPPEYDALLAARGYTPPPTEGAA